MSTYARAKTKNVILLTVLGVAVLTFMDLPRIIMITILLFFAWATYDGFMRAWAACDGFTRKWSS
jgi:hypothetical protein